jgi:hypothetical protein
MHPKRSHLAAPMVIGDEMPPCEQVDGKFYTSKAAFRAKGRELGLTEVGNENLKRPPKTYTKLKRSPREALERAKAQYSAGRRPGRPGLRGVY